jgi:hypothetical protein
MDVRTRLVNKNVYVRIYVSVTPPNSGPSRGSERIVWGQHTRDA